MINAIKKMLGRDDGRKPSSLNVEFVSLFSAKGFPAGEIYPYVHEFSFVPTEQGHFTKPGIGVFARSGQDKNQEHKRVYDAMQPLFLKPMKAADSGVSTYHESYNYDMVGFDGWAPLSVAMLSLSYGSAGTLIGELLYRATYIEPQSPAVKQWQLANSGALNQFESNLRNHAPISELAEGETQHGFEGLSMQEVASIFLMNWQIDKMRSEGFWLQSTHRHDSYFSIPEVKNYLDGRNALHEKNIEWALDWLEACGVAVDRNLEMVNVPQYVPLVIKSSPDI